MVNINKTLKEIVYGKGTIEQVEFLAELGGMTPEQYKKITGEDYTE